MWNGTAAITWRGEAVGKQLCILFWGGDVIVVDFACFCGQHSAIEQKKGGVGGVGVGGAV